MDDRTTPSQPDAAPVAVAAARRGAIPSPNAVPSRENWAGNYRYSTGNVLQPTTVAEVQEAVTRWPQLRALATRHSFNGLADSTVAQLSTLHLDGVTLDAARQTVTVGAGVRYGDLALELDRAGFALANLASLPHISVGGSISTATHGSGLRNANLSTAVRALEFVAADGSLHTLSREADGERFRGAVVGLGALGILTRVTLAIEPTYAMTQTVYQDLSFNVLRTNFEAVMSAGYSVSLFTDWQGHKAAQVWIKRRVDTNSEPVPAEPTFFGATLAQTDLHPVLGQDAERTTEQRNLPGPWYQRLPHFRLEFVPSAGREIQTEYFVPFDQAWEAVAAVETLRDSIAPHLLVSELRAVAADDLWMSMAFGRPSLAIHFTWKPEADAVARLLPQIEAKLRPFSARPHWAKVHTLTAPALAALYPRLDDFHQLVQHYDPRGRFRNDYLQRTVYR